MSDDLVKSHIEWLRGDHDACNPFLADRIEALEADRDALRDALRSIENAPRHSILSYYELVDWMQAVALATLNKEKDNE